MSFRMLGCSWLHALACLVKAAHTEHGMRDFKSDNAKNVTKIVARAKFRNAWIE